MGTERITILIMSILICLDFGAAGSDTEYKCATPSKRICKLSQVITGFKYTYRTCDGHCSNASRPGVKALLRLDFVDQFDCQVIDQTCMTDKSCCNGNVYTSTGSVKETPGISMSVKCINMKCTPCIPTNSPCTNTKLVGSIHECCDRLKDEHSSIECQSDSDTYTTRKFTCNNFDRCKKKNFVFSCFVPGVQQTLSKDLCQCPNPNPKKGDPQQVGYRCNAQEKCVVSCQFDGGPCQKDSDCCEQNNCDAKAGKCYACLRTGFYYNFGVSCYHSSNKCCKRNAHCVSYAGGQQYSCE